MDLRIRSGGGGNFSPADCRACRCLKTPTDFANALLNAIPEPDTGADMEAIVVWEEREGGNWHNVAKFNPLNTSTPYDGSTSMNAVGVQAFRDWEDG